MKEIAEYFKEIDDSDWVQEIISERFDNATELMTPNSVVYGGAVRDCLASKELVGDLDIAVSSSEYKQLLENFAKHPKWIEIRSNDGDQSELASLKISMSDISPRKYGDLSKTSAPMSSITMFTNSTGRVVQVMCSKYSSPTGSPFNAAAYMGRIVDIICCGVIMTVDGRVFEVVPDAYKDCVEGILRMNHGSDKIYEEALPSRVAKLVDRGWKSEINVERAMAEVKRNRKKGAEYKGSKGTDKEKVGFKHKMQPEDHPQPVATLSLNNRDIEIHAYTISRLFGGVLQKCLDAISRLITVPYAATRLPKGMLVALHSDDDEVRRTICADIVGYLDQELQKLRSKEAVSFEAESVAVLASRTHTEETSRIKERYMKVTHRSDSEDSQHRPVSFAEWSMKTGSKSKRVPSPIPNWIEVPRPRELRSPTHSIAVDNNGQWAVPPTTEQEEGE